ncbi:MAG: N-acetyltransferase, partial [Chloroflexi bacterium]|nr:N-acetyltransferase [Chloroflexota bacterium]
GPFSRPAARDVTIARAGLRDLAALLDIERRCFAGDAWPLLDVIGVLTWPEVVRFKAIAEGRVVGFAAADPHHRGETAMIATLAVLPEYRRQRIAWRLLESCEAALAARCICLTVRADNEGAQRLYERFGYRVTGSVPRYYTDGAAGISMEKDQRAS